MSSSGHLFIVKKFLCEKNIFFENAFFDEKIFSDLLHGVTALLVVIFFYNRWSTLLKNVLKETKRAFFIKKIFYCALFTGIVDAITTFFYVLFKLYGMPLLPLPIGFAITASILLLVTCYSKKKPNEYKNLANSHSFFSSALILGIVQGISLLPGISRLATTYVTSRFLGFSHRHAFEISFMIQWPLIVAASTLAAYKMYRVGLLWELLHLPTLLVILIGGVLAWYALVLTEYCARKNKLWFFSIYLFVLALFLVIV